MKNFEHVYTLKNNQQLVLRSPKIGDEEGLIEQKKQVDSETKFLTTEVGEFSFTLEQEQGFINRCLEDDNTFFIIADVEGEIVGTCSAARISTSKRYKHRASLGIAIKKEYWNLGIGKKMMQACIHWCKETGLEQVELNVVIGNERAKALYEKLGLETYGTKKHAMKYSDGSYADQYFMIMFLNR